MAGMLENSFATNYTNDAMPLHSSSHPQWLTFRGDDVPEVGDVIRPLWKTYCRRATEKDKTLAIVSAVSVYDDGTVVILPKKIEGSDTYEVVYNKRAYE